MWSYSGGGWGNGYITPEPNNYVSYPSTYGGVDPAYSADTGTGGNGLGGLWSAAISGIGQYAQTQAQADAAAEQSKMSAQARLDQLKQQREYEKQDKDYRKQAVSRWEKFFG